MSTATIAKPETPAALPKGTPPDIFTDPAGHLVAKGWKPLGFPQHPNTLWLDPSKPLEETWTTEPIMIQVERPKGGGKPGEVEMVAEQLTSHVGLGRNTLKPRVRSVCTPAGEPMTLTEAVRTCLHLDRMEAKKRRRA